MSPSLVPVHRVAAESALTEPPQKCNGLHMNGHNEPIPVTPLQLEQVESNKADTLMESANHTVAPEAPEATSHESALESLAKNLEATGKYRELKTDVKVNDMIAFRVMTADFQISGYVIGLVEELHGDVNVPSYDLTILIMGKSLRQ